MTAKRPARHESDEISWSMLIMLLVLSGIAIWALWDFEIDRWKSWAVAVLAVLFPAAALGTAIGIAKDETRSDASRLAAKAISWILLAPFAIAGIVLIGLLLLLLVGWLATVPVWAAVIIVLLLVIILLLFTRLRPRG